MNCFSKLFQVLSFCVFLTTVAYAKTENLFMKALVLTTTSYEHDYIALNFNSYGIPFDVYELSPTNLINGSLNLYDNNGQPKYNLIVVNGGRLSYESNNLWISSLTDEQWAELEEYEAKNGVRRVVIEEDPSENTQVELENPNQWGVTLSTQPLIVNTASAITKIFNEARVKPTAPFNVDGIYHTRVKVVDSVHTQPLLYYSDDGRQGAVAAIVSKFDNGREVMSFFFGFGAWSQTSLILNHVWLTWGTRGLFNGFRRVYFTPHIDDVFLSTELVDVKHNMEYSRYSEDFRTKPTDYAKIIQFQKDILKEMPEGSFFRVELAFNGNGILINVDYDYALEVDGERYVDLEFIKEPGTGEKRWPKENYQFSAKQLANFKKDDLFQYFANNDEVQKEFFWSSHTFSHENLDNASASDVDNEIRLNIQVAEMLGLTDKEWWSTGAIITPQISGIHNKDALEVFHKYGIYSATGDLSRTAITNLENPYLPYYTTLESSNFEGFPVIPRTPTEIYYFCSTREEDAWMFNRMYNSYYNRDLTWDEIAKSEADRTLQLMFKLRHEAHQFHQANLRAYPKVGNYGESLLEDWTRSVVKAYTQFVDWPLVSIKIDRQADIFIERAKLEACHPVTSLQLENGKVVGVTVTATTGDCTVPVTVPEGVQASSLPVDAELEQRGKDPLTVWVPLKQGQTKSFAIEPALDWANVSSSSNDSVTTIVKPVTTTTVIKTTTTIKKTTTTTKKTTTKRTTTKKTTTKKKTTTRKTTTKRNY